MSRPDQLFSYPREAAVERVVHDLGLRPTRVLAGLLPLWRVEVEATTTEGRPYELIDRFLEESIAYGGFGTVNELALFLSLDETLVDRALRFLARIGHLVESGGHYRLTELGKRSVEDGKRYEVRKADRRILYFEALSSRPLTRPYYNTRAVTVLTEYEATRLVSGPGGVRFQRFGGPPLGRSANALQDLVNSPERDRYNLPEGIEDINPIGADTPARLPVYLVRTESSYGEPQYLAYTQASREADPELSEICGQHAYARSHLEALEAQGLGGGDKANITDWADHRKLGKRAAVQRQTDGTWRLVLPERELTRGNGLDIGQVGRYKVSRDTVFQLWCDSPHARTRAFLERVEVYFDSVRSPNRDELQDRFDQFARQLELAPMSLESIAALAANAGRRHLSDQLKALP
ncbi:hypothetical protein K3N28_12490 [Glycomyces sp. TRM65418]|uniref:hypothetical protein n=1 Tax=Glycomyces sp. TRM65418 TaxID=2867006 RepID=UPI001CE5B99A|nr:hypothetical protein [Glycomyces sp. TRM65418]MCC3763882.1 hypothetical protein [Glycomyces sp. TRM65418]QZD53585.1 hypothetical protein K3N28_12420 [Glycomyces sp. TRM65418]